MIKNGDGITQIDYLMYRRANLLKNKRLQNERSCGTTALVSNDRCVAWKAKKERRYEKRIRWTTLKEDTKISKPRC